MITNKNMIALLHEIQKTCDIATSMEDVSFNSMIEDIRIHVDSAVYLAEFGRHNPIMLTPDGVFCISEDTGWPVEGKRLRPCLDEPYWYAHGTTLFDIRELRKVLGFKKAEYADDCRLDCSAVERVALSVIDAAKKRGITLTEAIKCTRLPIF